MDIKALADSVQRETEKIIVGKSDKIRTMLMAVLADGHILIDDIPGVGKTTLIKTLAKALGCDFGRIQFVPDLLPSDILGMNIFNQKTGDFELRQGPVMTNILLADEINRAIPRTQSALLEAMEEKQVTIDNQRFALPKPFLVFATQNPVESESTFKLPAAQMDRFLIRMSMGYPKAAEEKLMLQNLGDSIPFSEVNAVCDAASLKEAQRAVYNVTVSDAVCTYIVNLCAATRVHSALTLGVSPRGSRALYRASKALAAMNGRDFVTPDDVKQAAHPVLEHRLVVRNSNKVAGVTAKAVLDELLEIIPASVPLDKVAADEK